MKLLLGRAKCGIYRLLTHVRKATYPHDLTIQVICLPFVYVMMILIRAGESSVIESGRTRDSPGKLSQFRVTAEFHV